MRRYGWLVGVVVLLLGAGVLLPTTLNTNRAMLAHLHGQPATAASHYQQALARHPADAHLRWQTGLAQARAGELAAATDTLQPLATTPDAPPLALRLLITLLVQQGQPDQALALFRQQQPNPPRLPPGIAARLLHTALQAPDPPEDALSHALLLQALDVDPRDPRNQRLLDELAAPDFWQHERGQQMQAALVWLSEPPVPPATVAPVSPAPAVLAAMLDLPTDQIGIGDELLSNGSFEEYDPLQDFPQAWQQWSMRFIETGNPREDTALLVARTGTADHGNAALRVESVWRTRVDGLERVRAGALATAVPVAPDTPHVLTLSYRAGGTGARNVQIVLGSQSVLLPASDEWQTATIVFWTGADTRSLAPLLRLWNDGTVWFDALSLRPLSLPATPPAAEPLLQLAP